MADVLTAVGKYVEIAEKTQGWFRVKVAVPGKNYPLQLDTKRQSILDAVRETNGELATFSYTEKDSGNPNPNKPGSNYINRYLEGVELGAPAGSTSAGGSTTSEDVDWDGKERRDYRSRSWAHTFSAFSHTIKVDDDPILTFNRLKPFQQLIYEDIVGDLLEPDATRETRQEALPVPDDGSPTPDDDIPF